MCHSWKELRPLHLGVLVDSMCFHCTSNVQNCAQHKAFYRERIMPFASQVNNITAYESIYIPWGGVTKRVHCSYVTSNIKIPHIYWQDTIYGKDYVFCL